MNTKVLGRRVAAFLIDAVLIIGIHAVLFMVLKDDTVQAVNSGDLQFGDTTYINVTIGDTEYSLYGGKAALYFALSLIISIGYFVVLQGIRGFTLGKAMLGIRVVKDDGSGPPGIGRAFGRYFLYIADAFPYLIPYLTGFIVALVRKDNKRIGDLAAGTLVVDKDSIGAAPAVPADTAPTWVEGTRPS